MSSIELVQSQAEYEILPAKLIQARQQAIWTLMADSMKIDVDYGTPSYGGKQMLYKPGSEKILSMFQLAVDPLVEDLCPLDSVDPYAEFRIRVHVTVKTAGGRFAGKGVGECSSWEEKYKWRRAVNEAEFLYMQQQNPNLVRIKFGVDFKTKKDYQIKQVRVPTADIANTIIKMGKKRAQIDATLTATAASAIFSQDLEDMPEEIAAELNENQERQQGQPLNQGVRKPQRKQAETPKPEAEKKEEKPRDPDCITEPQQKMLYAISKQCKLSEQELKDKLKAEFKDKDGKPVEHFRDILKVDFQKLIDSIDTEFKFHTRSKDKDDF